MIEDLIERLDRQKPDVTVPDTVNQIETEDDTVVVYDDEASHSAWVESDVAVPLSKGRGQ